MKQRQSEQPPDEDKQKDEARIKIRDNDKIVFKQII